MRFTLSLTMLMAVVVLQACSSSVAENPPPVESDPAQWTPPAPGMKLELTDAQWRERLTEDQYYILRQDGTEYPFTSPLNHIKHEDMPGDFACAGCASHLFQTEHKYNSGTGWPSFDRPAAPDRVKNVPENDFWNRIEVVCAGCDGHLGHVFEDGPRDTTGLRYCINGDAMLFYPRPNAVHPPAEEETQQAQAEPVESPEEPGE
ncbi:MAG: peptide-methionine (R)-S-oxide reductase MsrB [Planctomycetota bacterium]